MTGYALRIVLFIVAFFSLLFMLARYGSRLRITEFRKERALKKIDMLPLGYKRFLFLVEYEGRLFLIGAGEREISLLSSWQKEGN